MNNLKRSPARQCPNGHTMDPNWDTCPYCEREQKSQVKSSRPDVSNASTGGKTTVGEVFQETGGRKTRSIPVHGIPSQGSGGHVGVGETRRIVGVMITYSWRPEGELFPIREGKNFIGSGRVSSDSSHSECHIQIPNDNMMSSEHALILCPSGKKFIKDKDSSNGTFFNGNQLIPDQAEELSDYAEIKTGNTTWMFIEIKAPGKTDPVPDEKPPDQYANKDTVAR